MKPYSRRKVTPPMCHTHTAQTHAHTHTHTPLSLSRCRSISLSTLSRTLSDSIHHKVYAYAGVECENMPRAFGAKFCESCLDKAKICMPPGGAMVAKICAYFSVCGFLTCWCVVCVWGVDIKTKVLTILYTKVLGSFTDHSSQYTKTHTPYASRDKRPRRRPHPIFLLAAPKAVARRGGDVSHTHRNLVTALLCPCPTVYF